MPPTMNNNPGNRVASTGLGIMFLAVSCGVCSGEYGSLLALVGVLVGANLILAGVRMAEETTTPMDHEPHEVLAGVGALTAFLRRNLSVVGLAVASSALAAVAGEAAPTICFCFFALFLLGISLITIGVRGQ